MPTIAGYTCLEPIGWGGSGLVLRARQEAFGRVVAIKVLPGAARDPDVFARFRRECHALGAVGSHPNMAAVYDCGVSEEGDGYLAIELLTGGSLAERLSAGALPWADAAALGVLLAGALETAHRVGVLHRDVKPENVLFDGLDNPKLLDFGIASVPGVSITQAHAASLTVAHAAPEVVAGAPATVASDVYSLASTVYAALRGEPAFTRNDGETLVPLLARIAAEPPPPLADVGVPSRIAVLVEQGLAKDPGARPVSAEAFGVLLATALEDEGGLALLPPVLNPDPDGATPPRLPEPTAPDDGTLVSAGLAGSAARVAPPVAPGQPRSARRRRTSAVLAALAVLLAAVAGYSLAGRHAPAAVADSPLGSADPRPSTSATASRSSRPPSLQPTRTTAPSKKAPSKTLLAPTITKVTVIRQPGSSGTHLLMSTAADTPRTSQSQLPPSPSSPVVSSSAPAPSEILAPAVPQPAGVSVRWRSTAATAVRVRAEWSAGAGGGTVQRYQVQVTQMKGTAKVGQPVRTTTAASSVTLDLASLQGAQAWYRWRVRAVGPGGSSAWADLPANLSHLVGKRAGKAVAGARAIGLRTTVRYKPAPRPAVRGTVIHQSRAAGSYAARTVLRIVAYSWK